MAGAADGSDARMKLAHLSERFSGFERQIDVEVKARRETEETQVTSLQDNIARLEKTLNSEIKRRVEANKALQGMFEAQMATVQDKLEAGLLERLDSLHHSVGSLNDRVDAVEQDFHQTREQYIRDIEDKSLMVAKDAQSLQTAFQNERSDRKEREMLIVGKLRDLDARTAGRLESEARFIEEISRIKDGRARRVRSTPHRGKVPRDPGGARRRTAGRRRPEVPGLHFGRDGRSQEWSCSGDADERTFRRRDRECLAPLHEVHPGCLVGGEPAGRARRFCCSSLRPRRIGALFNAS